MKRYQLPDILGGGEIEAVEIWGGCAGGRPEYELGGGITILAPAGQPLEMVKPPLPPEPPVGSVVLFGGEAVQRFEDNELADDPSEHWASVGSPARWTWARLIEINGEPPVLLVPAPEPVELPWSVPDLKVGQTYTQTGPAEHVYVAIRGVGGADEFEHITPDIAREMARALWTAADAAEAQS